MRARRVAITIIAFRWCAVACVLACVPLGLAFVQVSGQEAGAPRGPIHFDHDDHVYRLWSKPGTPECERDCRGCHAFGEKQETTEARSTCASCHWQVGPRGKAGRSALELVLPNSKRAMRFAGTFFHSDHRKDLECRDCHLADLTPGEVADGASISARMPVPDGILWCVACHDESVERAEQTRRPPAKSFADGINASAPMQPGSGERFLHRDHLTDAELLDPRSCAPCHGGINNASELNFASEAVRFRKEGCGACHVAAEVAEGRYRLLSFAGANARTPSVAKGTFSHAKHLDADARAKSGKDLDGERSIHERGCLACHKPATLPAGDVWDADMTTLRYAADCESACHAHKNAESWPRLPDHGDMTECVGCHAPPAEGSTFVSIAELESNRPRAKVPRRSRVQFRVLAQSHPYIASNPRTNKEIEADCSACHKGGLADLPSRITARTFRHETHLPEQWTGKDCVPCHGGLEQTQNPLELSRKFTTQTTAGAAGVVYDEKACVKCHGGVVAAVADPAAPAEEEVVWFPHAKHVAAVMDGRGLGCESCHGFVTQPGGGAGATGGAAGEMTTFAGALDCTQCHDHKEHVAITGAKSARAGLVRGAEYFRSCARCHVTGLPAPGAQVLVDSYSSGAPQEAQFHPPWDEQARKLLAATFAAGRAAAATDPTQQAGKQYCRGCHVVNDGPLPFVRAELTDATSVQARMRYPEGIYHDRCNPEKIMPDGSANECLRCHWNEQGESKFRGVAEDPAKLRAPLGGKYP